MKKYLILLSVLFPFFTFAYTSDSCVIFVREISDVDFKQIGIPNNLEVNFYKPIPGAIVLFSYEPFGHMSYILSVSTSTMEVVEANFKKNVIGRRIVKIDDPKIRGYYVNNFLIKK